MKQHRRKSKNKPSGVNIDVVCECHGVVMVPLRLLAWSLQFYQFVSNFSFSGLILFQKCTENSNLMAPWAFSLFFFLKMGQQFRTGITYTLFILFSFIALRNNLDRFLQLSLFVFLPYKIRLVTVLWNPQLRLFFLFFLQDLQKWRPLKRNKM